jgi:hypothetical protein
MLQNTLRIHRKLIKKEKKDKGAAIGNRILTMLVASKR